jgi:hypothetical protein
MLRELRFSRLLSRDVCNILACLHICNQSDLALHLLMNKSNFERYMLHSLVRKIISRSNGNRSCIVKFQCQPTQVLMIIISYSALQIEQYCFNVLNFDNQLFQRNCFHHSSAECYC